MKILDKLSEAADSALWEFVGLVAAFDAVYYFAMSLAGSLK